MELIKKDYSTEVKKIYSEMGEYARSCGIEAKALQTLIVDILFPLGIFGEKIQKERMRACSAPCHHSKIWALLKAYETCSFELGITKDEQ